LREFAKANGFSHVATGHYCRKALGRNGLYQLLEGVDKNKDQSYFLALLQQQQLADALFPIGDLKKSEVRAIAEEFQLKTAHKKDSQGICFLGKMPIQAFLREHIPDNPGPIVDPSGKILGEHKGLHLFTIGQRKGIGVASNVDFENYVVVGKDLAHNSLIIAFETPNTPGLYCKSVEIENLSFIGQPLTTPCQLLGKTRYRNPSQPLTFTPLSQTRAHIAFDSPQRALTLGQILALYDGPTTLGGGTYCRIGEGGIK
jgi:tRNA-specific 2-thiouridylase